MPSVLKTTDVAVLFRVSTKTVDIWRKQGLIPYFMTPKGWARYRREDIEPLLRDRRGRTPEGS